MYTFKAVKNYRPQYNTAKVGLPALSLQLRNAATTENGYGLFVAKFRGSLITLFGLPNRSTADSSSVFTYFIEATNGQGQSWILTAYQGPSGPAIGGKSRDTTNRPAAEALLQLVLNTPPADYDEAYYDSETNFTVFYGCRNNVCYYREIKGNSIP